MRKIALTKRATDGVKRVMIHDTGEGVYLFGYRSLEDGPASFDKWYASLPEADLAAEESYDIEGEDWQVIPDPQENCQQDWIAPVRVKGRDTGNPEFGVFERFEQGEWKLIDDANA